MAFSSVNWSTVGSSKRGNSPSIYGSDGGQTLVATKTGVVITTAVI
jgi:hypothetical protein